VNNQKIDRKCKRYYKEMMLVRRQYQIINKEKGKFHCKANPNIKSKFPRKTNCNSIQKRPIFPVQILGIMVGINQYFLPKNEIKCNT
jgi:hypothetical protein